MNVVLVNPPNHRFDFGYLAPPLGLLHLASVAMEAGAHPTIIDLALPEWAVKADDVDMFYVEALGEIMKHEPDIVAFTSMGINSHVCLSLARLIRGQDRSCWIVFGGPHLGVLGHRLGIESGFCDFVIAGSGEAAFSRVISRRNKGTPGPVEPRTFREKNVSLPPTPIEAYSLIDLNKYFEHSPRRLGLLETERGCIFKCAFCYSPGHYDGLQKKAPDHVVRDLVAYQQMGFEYVFFVNDNLINHPADTRSVLEAIGRADLGIKWTCYLTLPTLDEGMPELLSRAGCDSAYLGLDAVTAKQERLYRKRFLKGTSLDKVKTLVDQGIKPTVAFIIDPYEQDQAELLKTIEAACLFYNVGASIHLNVLSIYPGTKLTNNPTVRYSDLKCRVSFDVPKAVQSNPDAIENPALFPFHSTSMPEGEWQSALLAMRSMNDVFLGAARLIEAVPAARSLVEFSGIAGSNEGIFLQEKQRWTAIHCLMFDEFSKAS